LLLVRPGTPATIDDELDAVVCGIGCCLAQGAEESWIKLGYTRNPVIEDRRAVRDGTISLAKRTRRAVAGLAERGGLSARSTVLTANTTVLTAGDAGG
jgi:hypothetical protein